MEVCDESSLQVKCYKCTESLYRSLNVIQNDSENIFIFWNKYQILLYEGLNFDLATRIFTPEFQTSQIILSNNYLVCVDCTGNIHTISLKFKTMGQKRLKCSFLPREQGILKCIKYSSDTTLSLKLESGRYFLCLHKLCNEFQMERKILIETDDTDWPLCTSHQDNCILTSHSITKQDFALISPLFGDDVWRNHSLVLISFDKTTVYACIFSQKSPDEVVCLKNLYTGPTEICNLLIAENDSLEVLIGLVCGTLVRLKLKNKDSEPEIIHLNTALSKILLKSNDSIVYSDGISLWSAENINSKENMIMKQFLIKDVKDFIKCNEQLICTTFTNLIYTVPIENENSFFKCEDDKYCPAEKVISNSECLYRIHREIEKNKEIINKINEEGNYLTAVSLSRKPEIMDKIIKENVIIYDNYEDVITENPETTLTEDLKEYFKPEILLVFVKIMACPIQHSMSNILQDILANVKIHITLTSDKKVLKTTSINLHEPLKKIQILIPLDRRAITRLNVQFELISEIPGALDTNKTIWNILHRKTISLNAEHFIKTSTLTQKTKLLKEPRNNIKELIRKMNENYHGEIFKVIDRTKTTEPVKGFAYYIKLPTNYREIINNENTFNKHFNSQKAKFIKTQLAQEELLKSKCDVHFEIANEKVYIKIITDDFTSPIMEVSCRDVRIAFDLRNFLANTFYGEYEKCTNEEFISNALYTSTENLQKEINKCSSSEDCQMLFERFQKNVIASLPL